MAFETPVQYRDREGAAFYYVSRLLTRAVLIETPVQYRDREGAAS